MNRLQLRPTKSEAALAFHWQAGALGNKNHLNVVSAGKYVLILLLFSAKSTSAAPSQVAICLFLHIPEVADNSNPGRSRGKGRFQPDVGMDILAFDYLQCVGKIPSVSGVDSWLRLFGFEWA